MMRGDWIDAYDRLGMRKNELCMHYTVRLPGSMIRCRALVGCLILVAMVLHMLHQETNHSIVVMMMRNRSQYLHQQDRESNNGYGVDAFQTSVYCSTAKIDENRAISKRIQKKRDYWEGNFYNSGISPETNLLKTVSW